MNSEFLNRVKREISFTVEGARETVIALSDHVNRKVEVLKLHWRAAAITSQVAQCQQELGTLLAEILGQFAEGSQAGVSPDRQFLQGKLEETAARLRLLKRELQQLDRAVSEVENEVLLEDLLKFQRELSARSAGIQWVTVAQGAWVVGRAMDQLDLSPGTHMVAVFRGPALLTPDAGGGLRPGDHVVLLGHRTDLQKDLPGFTGRRRATA